ncbi:hypothetical protein, partial [Oceanicoccus sp.]|uniref:hypothetical protein n=1 Tax=Oceanicoccus sp. TaxID=2691044 RepID=UPI002627D7FE
ARLQLFYCHRDRFIRCATIGSPSARASKRFTPELIDERSLWQSAAAWVIVPAPSSLVSSFEKTGERFIRRQLFVPALRLIREGLLPYTETVQYTGVLYYSIL